jgi:hypothetical protein
LSAYAYQRSVSLPLAQLLLLLEAVDDYVGSDNPVRFIDAFVDGLHLAAAGSAASSRR